jgi:hypothetical protein
LGPGKQTGSLQRLEFGLCLGLGFLANAAIFQAPANEDGVLLRANEKAFTSRGFFS